MKVDSQLGIDVDVDDNALRWDVFHREMCFIVRWERDNVVYWETKGKINNDLKLWDVFHCGMCFIVAWLIRKRDVIQSREHTSLSFVVSPYHILSVCLCVCLCVCVVCVSCVFLPTDEVLYIYVYIHIHWCILLSFSPDISLYVLRFLNALMCTHRGQFCLIYVYICVPRDDWYGTQRQQKCKRTQNWDGMDLKMNNLWAYMSISMSRLKIVDAGA